MEKEPVPFLSVVARYDRLAACYDSRWRRYHERTLTALLALVDFSGSEHVLDVGCGTGEFERLALARWPGLSVVGVDGSKAMLAIARKKLERSPNVRFALAAAERLPCATEAFDVVVCANMLHYLSDPARLLHECARVLRPRGRCALVDWCRDAWFGELFHRWLRLSHRAYGGMLRLEEARQLLERSGLSVTRAERFFTLPLYGMMRLASTKGNGHSP